MWEYAIGWGTGMLSSIISVAFMAMQLKILEWISNALKDFLQKQLPALAKTKEVELNARLAGLAKGDDFFGFPVVDATANSIFLLVRFVDFEAKIIPGLKINLARATVELARRVNLTNASQPPIQVIDVPAYAIEIAIHRDTYDITLGGGADTHIVPHFAQYRTVVRWDTPTLRLYGFYAESQQGGFIISVHANLPFPIPLGNSGLGLCGVGLTYGERFAAKLKETKGDPIEEMRKATAEEYVKWAKKPLLEQWIPVKNGEDVRIFGVTSDIGDVSSGGKIFRFDRAGLSFISYGPTIFIGGSFIFFDSIRLGEIIGAIDLRSQTVFLSETIDLKLTPL
jgi:hypothetical protein